MLLEVKGLWVHFSGAEALRNVSIQVAKESIISIIGANGAGKTTLLRTISGLEKPTRGEIVMMGRRIDNMPPEKIVALGISHCPERRRLFSLMSVKENLLSGAFLRRDKAEIARDLEELYGLFPILKERAKQAAGTLSGGEQQITAIARALMSKPKILLLDEPSAGLSPVMTQEVSNIIRDICRNGVSVLLVEQNSSVALHLASYAYVLESGAVRLEGTTSELLDSPIVKEAYLG